MPYFFRRRYRCGDMARTAVSAITTSSTAVSVVVAAVTGDSKPGSATMTPMPVRVIAGTIWTTSAAYSMYAAICSGAR
jgi:hypothetical protein